MAIGESLKNLPVCSPLMTSSTACMFGKVQLLALLLLSSWYIMPPMPLSQEDAHSIPTRSLVPEASHVPRPFAWDAPSAVLVPLPRFLRLGDFIRNWTDAYATADSNLASGDAEQLANASEEINADQPVTHDLQLFKT